MKLVGSSYLKLVMTILCYQHVTLVNSQYQIVGCRNVTICKAGESSGQPNTFTFKIGFTLNAQDFVY